MIPQPPPGQGPVDPRGAFAPPSPPQGGFGSPPFPGPMMSSYPGPGMMPPAGPPAMPPPPGYMMSFPPLPPAPPRRGGAGRAILLTLLIVGLCLSLLVNLALMAGGAVGGAGDQATVQDGARDQQIAVIPLRGIIEGNAAVRFDQYADRIEADPNVKALVVEIDSPGGTVTASDEIYERLRRLKANRPMPVVVTMGSLATSGGYFTACGADYIFAQKTTMTGNIGVLMPRFNFNKLMEKYGVEETTIVSSGATFKNAGSSYGKETPEERRYLQELIDTAFGRFKEVVVQGRGAKLKANIDDIANGKVYTAKEAAKLGLIDQEGYADDAYRHAASAAGLGKPMVVRYETPPTFMERLMSKSTAGDAASASAGGVTINVDAKLIEQLSTPRLLYLWRGQ